MDHLSVTEDGGRGYVSDPQSSPGHCERESPCHEAHPSVSKQQNDKMEDRSLVLTGRKGEVGVAIGEGQQDYDLVGPKLMLSESISSFLHMLDSGIG